MFSETKDFKYYAFSFSNFIAALGGGTILGRGIDVINLPFLKGGTLVALGIGILFVLFFSQCIPEKYSKKIGPWFSIICALTSCVLLFIFNRYETHGFLIHTVPAVLFFSLLSLRFGFWFYARTLRVARAASQQRSVAWVEFGYYVGTVLGLVTWRFLGINVGLFTALIIDICFQCTAGAIDIFLYRWTTQSAPEQEGLTETPTIPTNVSLLWRLTLIIPTLATGVQTVIFTLAHHFPTPVDTYILAVFYSGVAFAAAFYKKLNFSLKWRNNQKSMIALPALCFQINARLKYVNIAIVGALLLFSTLMVIALAKRLEMAGLHASHPQALLLSLFMVFVFVSAALYEIFSIVVLDRIGIEEKHAPVKKMITRTYGLMGIAATACLWIFGLIAHPFAILTWTLTLSSLLTMLLLNRSRHLEPTQERSHPKNDLEIG